MLEIETTKLAPTSCGMQIRRAVWISLVGHVVSSLEMVFLRQGAGNWNLSKSWWVSVQHHIVFHVVVTVITLQPLALTAFISMNLNVRRSTMTYRSLCCPISDLSDTVSSSLWHGDCLTFHSLVCILYIVSGSAWLICVCSLFRSGFVYGLSLI